MDQVTIVTNCDKNFVWGVYLLLASFRKAGTKVPVHVHGKGLSEEDIALLEQFPPMKIYQIDESSQKNLNMLKPEIFFTAETPLITWMDADCIVTGDVTPLLLKTGKSIQLRYRSKEENATLFKNESGKIPDQVLDIWRSDIQDLQTSRILTTMTSCCFTIHREFLPLIELWKKQMDKVLPNQYNGVTLPSSKGYFMTDESVFNSLLAYSRLAPPVTNYLLDKERDRLLVHFVSRPKPWQFWRKEHLRWYNETVGIVEWCKENQFKTPPMNWSLDRKYQFLAYSGAYIRGWLSNLKHAITTRS